MNVRGAVKFILHDVSFENECANENCNIYGICYGQWKR